eukprot:TRINITY_DN17763_c0_g1_i2.p1 TRINITY_DN17763_c0_g1~~TRINITY_DN17763_c0_g1_i2.p1  ORF type:complete len:256 (-),score=49.95 TRINITY_DN17763_c0_g1_i2:398-1165(-)
MAGFQEVPLAEGLMVQESGKRTNVGARVENWLFRAERLRRVRMTYFNAGAAGQAFNCLVYPHLGSDLPLLGIDLLAFGKGTLLCVLDYQPLSQEPHYMSRHLQRLAPIHARHRNLCHAMTRRHFDITRFFSPHLILFRSTNNLGPKDPAIQVPAGQFFAAFCEYLALYLDLVNEAELDLSPASLGQVARAQAAYDEYSEERDPATKLFAHYFGQQWSEQFTNEFLFPWAKANSEGANLDISGASLADSGITQSDP